MSPGTCFPAGRDRKRWECHCTQLLWGRGGKGDGIYKPLTGPCGSWEGPEEDSDREQAPKWVITALDANPLPVPAAHRPAATGCHLEFALPLLAPFYPGLLPVWAEEGW